MPNITHAFAIDKGYYGCIWKIYIEAEAPNGEMDKIAVVVRQTGYGYYPTDWIILNPDYRIPSMEYLQLKSLVFARVDTDYYEGFHP